MKNTLIILLVTLCFCCTGCIYPGIHGTVVDIATGKPLEGALVVAQWTKSHGFGLSYHTLSKITETVTDKAGAFSISGTYDPFVDPPVMIIYKDGYIPWRNDKVFPGDRDEHRKDHEWKNNETYRLDIFTDKYTARQEWEFMDYGIIGLGSAPIFFRIHSEISGRKVDEDRTNKLKNKKH